MKSNITIKELVYALIHQIEEITENDLIRDEYGEFICTTSEAKELVECLLPD